MKNPFAELVHDLVTKLKNALRPRVLRPSYVTAVFLILLLFTTRSAVAADSPNTPPTLTSIEGGNLNYSEGQGAVAITSAIVVSDVDNATLTGATIRIVTNYLNSEDVLSFTNALGITGSFDNTTGILTLSGGATLADYQTAIRSITYTNTNTGNPSTLSRVVSFVVNDGIANSTAAIRSINVAGVNDAPVLSAIEVSDMNYIEGQAATSITSSIVVADVDHTMLSGAVIRITTNYLSTEDVLSFTNASGITGAYDNATGTMTLSGSASVANYQNALRNVRYRNSNNNAPSALTRTITFTVTDGALTSGAVTRNITVSPVNDAPNASADFFSTSSNTPVTANLKSNDTDAENNTITLNTTPVVQPLHGSVVIQSSGSFTYTPNGLFTGTETFTYEICDNGTENSLPAPKCSQGVVTIIVNPVNTKFNIVGNNAVQISEQCFILTNELNNQQGAVWSRSTLDLRYSFELNFEVMLSDTGVVKDNGADGIIFALQRDVTPPPSNAAGSPLDARGSTGEYLGIGGVSPSIGIEIDTYQNGGEPAEDHIAISRDGSVYNILSPAVAAKLDGSNNPVNIEDGASHTVRIAWDKPTNTLNVYFDGVLRTTYTGDITNTIFGGDPTNIYWGFSASTGGSTNLHGVCGIGLAPINLPAQASTHAASVNEDAVLNGSLLASTSDPEGGALSFTAETKATAHGTVTINNDGTFTYTPATNYSGPDAFTYNVCDTYATPGCNSATANITITPVNDAPVAVVDAYDVTEDTPFFKLAADGVLKNDYDLDGPSITVVQVEPTTRGLLSISANGSFSYIPFANNNGVDEFSYCVFDGVLYSDTVVVRLNIAPVNDAPLGDTDNATTNEEASVAIGVLINDIDVDNAVAPSTVTIKDDAGHGQTSVDPVTGVITYTPDEDRTDDDTFTYTVKDISGAESDPITVHVSISPVNDAPKVAADHVTVVEDSFIDISVLANDVDIDDLIDITTVSAGDAESGDISVDNITGVVTYTPHQDFTGNDSFTYTVKDVSGALSLQATVTIDVTPANDAPVAIDDGPITFNKTSSNVVIDAIANDTDPDEDELTIISVGTPNVGSAIIENNQVIYQPSALTGASTIMFSYTIQDEEGLTDEGVIALTYQPLHVSEGFSPNGDNQNDWWFIQGVESFPGNVLNVFDRWGLPVYSITGYDNATIVWDGVANKGATSGKVVDQGTYYYTLTLGGEAKPVSGFVVIVK